MKLKCLTCLLGAMLFVLSMPETSAQERRMSGSRLKPVNFTMELKPFSVLSSPDLDGIRLENGGSSEEIDGTGSWTPSLNVGVNFDTPFALFDLTAGVGAIANDVFSGSFSQAKFGMRFKLARHHVTFGPHIGVIGFYDMEWDEDADVEMDDSSGSFVGVDFSAGGKVCSFFLTIDYVDLELDATSSGGWQFTRDSTGDLSSPSTSGKIDLSGVRYEMGLVFRF